PKIRTAMIDNGSPEPEFHTDDDRTHFLTVLPANMEAYEDDAETQEIAEPINPISGAIGGAIGGAIDLTPRQTEILEIIKNNNAISQREIAKKVGINNSAVIKTTDKLKQLGVLKRVGGTRGHWEVIHPTS
ncbi:MAG: MarR family transcriptional regulator, partial [Bacteroidales bacterium]